MLRAPDSAAAGRYSRCALRYPRAEWPSAAIGLAILAILASGPVSGSPPARAPRAPRARHVQERRSRGNGRWPDRPPRARPCCWPAPPAPPAPSGSVWPAAPQPADGVGPSRAQSAEPSGSPAAVALPWQCPGHLPIRRPDVPLGARGPPGVGNPRARGRPQTARRPAAPSLIPVQPAAPWPRPGGTPVMDFLPAAVLSAERTDS